MKRVLLAAATVFSLLSCNAASHAVVLYPMSDAPTLSTEPDTNYNGYGNTYDAELWTGIGSGASEARSYLKFNLTGLPAVYSARLYLFVAAAGSPGDADVSAYSTDASWSEGALTWNNQPALGTLGSITSVGNAAGWRSWEVTSLVQASAGSKASIALVSSGGARTYFARETASDFMPYLDVECVVPEPATLALFGALLPLVCRSARQKDIVRP